MSILFPKSHTYYTKSNGEFVEGNWVKGSEFENPVSLDIQPMVGEELRNLDIGRETTGLIKIYSNIQLTVAEEETKKNGDIINFQNKKWEVIREEPWQGGLINHYKYYAELRAYERGRV